MVKSLINLKKLFESEILRFHVLKESEKNINCFILNKLFVLMQVFFSNLFLALNHFSLFQISFDLIQFQTLFSVSLILCCERVSKGRSRM